MRIAEVQDVQGLALTQSLAIEQLEKRHQHPRALDGVLGRRGERLVDAIGSLGALLGGYPRGSILRSAPPGGRQRKRRREREQDQRGGSPQPAHGYFLLASAGRWILRRYLY